MSEILSPTILIVDDESSHRLIAKRGLKQQLPACKFIEMESVRDSLQQINTVKNREFALFVIDLNLGVESGLTIVRAIRKCEVYSATPIVVISTSELPDDVFSSYKDGANAFVVKSPDIMMYQSNLGSAANFLLRQN